MPLHRQGCSTPREAGIWDPKGGVPRPPDALPDACDAPASQHIGRLSGRPWDAVVWLPYVGFYPLGTPHRLVEFRERRGAADADVVEHAALEPDQLAALVRPGVPGDDETQRVNGRVAQRIKEIGESEAGRRVLDAYLGNSRPVGGESDRLSLVRHRLVSSVLHRGGRVPGRRRVCCER